MNPKDIVNKLLEDDEDPDFDMDLEGWVEKAQNQIALKDIYVNDVDSPFLTIKKGTVVHANNLVSLAGVSLEKGSSFYAPVLKSVRRRVQAAEGSVMVAKSLEYVGDSVGTKMAFLELPSLKTIGNGLYVIKNSRLTLDLLESVGGNLYVERQAAAELPALKNVGKALTVDVNASLTSESLLSVGHYIDVVGELIAPKLGKWTGRWNNRVIPE